MSKESNEIINFYTKLDPGKQIITPNPNFNKHNLKIPFRGIINAPSGSGKTNFLVNIISKFCAGKGTFDSITIITKNKEEELYDYLGEKGVVIKEGLKNIPILDDYDKTVAHLLVFDDLLTTKNISVISDYYLRCRKLNVSALFLGQRYYDVPKIIRENCNYLFILKMGNVRDVKLIMSEYSLGVTNDQLLNMYTKSVAQKFNVLTIDKEIDDEKKKFRHNLLEYLDPNDF